MTAQGTDIVAFTQSDYDGLRQKIYSPKIEPTVEVNSLFYI